jgi:signal peptidase II
MSTPRRKARVFWPLALLLLLADCSSKRWASDNLQEYVAEPVLGDVVRFTLAHNPGAAMGLSLGAYSRVGFTLLTVVALVALFRLYRAADGGDVRLAAATALVTGGALGNLLDRLRWDRGVVDFIDIGVGASRFWTFNVADVGVTVGAAALAILLWRADGQVAPAGGRASPDEGP